MSGFFGVASRRDCVLDLFFGVDYHSHLGTRRAGMTVHGGNGFNRAIHNIENSPFRTKFEHDIEEFEGNLGIGCISDTDPQPLLIHSHLGSYAITTVGHISNAQELIDEAFQSGHIHFMEMSGGRINSTELVAALINQQATLKDGLLYAQEKIRKISVAGYPDRYDKNTRHDHLVCRRCGALLDIHLSDLTRELERQTGFAIEGYDLKIRCLCPQCRAKEQAADQACKSQDL